MRTSLIAARARPASCHGGYGGRGGHPQGTHPKIVAEMLGHSKIGTTMDLYSRVTPAMQREATLAMEAILRR